MHVTHNTHPIRSLLNCESLHYLPPSDTFLLYDCLTSRFQQFESLHPKTHYRYSIYTTSNSYPYSDARITPLMDSRSYSTIRLCDNSVVEVNFVILHSI